MTATATFTLDDSMVIEIHDERLLVLASGSAPGFTPDSKDGYCNNLLCGNSQCLDTFCIKI